MTQPTMPSFTDATFVHQGDLNKLSNGINNLSLVWSGAVATRTYVPAVSVSLNASQSIPNNADTTVSWNVAGVNNDAMWASGKPTQLVVNTAGVYVAWAQIHFDINSTGHRASHVMLNGQSIIANSVAVNATMGVGASADTVFTCVTPPTRLGPGAQIYLSVYQNSGAGLNLLTSLSGTRLSMIRIGA